MSNCHRPRHPGFTCDQRPTVRSTTIPTAQPIAATAEPTVERPYQRPAQVEQPVTAQKPIAAPTTIKRAVPWGKVARSTAQVAGFLTAQVFKAGWAVSRSMFGLGAQLLTGGLSQIRRSVVNALEAESKRQPRSIEPQPQPKIQAKPQPIVFKPVEKSHVDTRIPLVLPIREPAPRRVENESA